jgi:hypothetical protein
MNLSIDRIEEGVAVLIGRGDESMRLTIPATLLPPGSREGDILTFTLERDPAATGSAKKRTAEMIEKLKKNP